VKVSKLKPNPNNPRLVKDSRFALLVKSIQELPKMMPLSPIIVDENFMVLSGNMRLKAIQHLGMKEIPDDWVVQDKHLTEDEKKRIVIAANVSFGEMDWSIIEESWSTEPLAEWGLEIPDFGKHVEFDAKQPVNQWFINIECANESETKSLYDEFLERGLKVKIIQ